ncbi:hypothetical protein [Methylobacterium komagatae]
MTDYANAEPNGSAIETVAFAAGKAAPTFKTTNGMPYLVNQGDVLTPVAPATQDASLADLIGFIALQ